MYTLSPAFNMSFLLRLNGYGQQGLEFAFGLGSRRRRKHGHAHVAVAGELERDVIEDEVAELRVDEVLQPLGRAENVVFRPKATKLRRGRAQFVDQFRERGVARVLGRDRPELRDAAAHDAARVAHAAARGGIATRAPHEVAAETGR